MSNNHTEHCSKTKEEYIDSLSAELKEWSAEIDVLSAKAETAEADMQVKYHEEIESLRVRERAAVEKIKELRAASDDAWDAIKDTAEHVWHDFRTGLANVISKFK
ncbi:coiled coil domain-containing protein [Methylomonas sp. AM2-LC]|uniref:coiled coil domain-containing protein n=1 Tax=Methylomonas sp. AM2-LC TaxID=3153301 RepID=UPI003264F0C8